MDKKSSISYLSAISLPIMGVYFLLFAGLYYSSFSTMIKWWAQPDYSYCYLVPFIILYLLWEKRQDFLNQRSIPTWIGFLPLAAGIVFYWLGELGGEFYILYISSWILLVGICILNLGFKKVKIILFPICLILTMFPLPNFFNFKITLALKLISSKVGVMMMQAYGMSAFREGNVIDLGFTQLQVVDACSGLRYLFPMLVLSVLVAYFHKAAVWKKIIIVVSSIPLTILTNSLRIALTGILSELFGSSVVEGFFHDFEGWLIFMFTIAVLLLEIWIMDKVFPGPVAKPVSGTGSEKKTKPKKVRPALGQPKFVLSVVLIGLTLMLSQGIEFREAIPMKKSFDNFPSRIGKWDGMKKTMDAKFIEKLDFTEYIMMDFHDDQEKNIDFYVAFYDSQRKGESIHSPSSCFRGGGWEFKQAGKSFVPLSDNQSQLPVNLAIIKKGGQQQVSFYWFPSRGRNLTNAYEMKWFNFWDALTQRRTDGALVRVISHVYPDETLENAQLRLETFIQEMMPVLSQFLPT